MKCALLALLVVVSSGFATTTQAQDSTAPPGNVRPEPQSIGRPLVQSLKRAGSTSIDVRNLPRIKQKLIERPELEPPEIEPIELPGSVPQPAGPEVPAVNAPAPAPLKNFAGLDLATWGAGVPPDTNGDVGPTYFVQTVNTAVGIYNKSTGAQVAAFSFNSLMSQGNFGNTCDTNNAGDPVVLYDTFEDRWVITDFAFFGIGGFQCFAVSKTGDPVSGGWNFYQIAIADGFGDYPKFGIWPDGLYMMVNLYTQSNGGTFSHPRGYALNKAQMYAGAPDVQVVAFDFPARDFDPLPANARLQTGTPPLGSPNYYSVAYQYFNAISIYKFHVDWARISTSALTGPFVSMAPTSWAVPPFSIAVPGGTTLETVAVRMMAQNQYTNIGNVESVWSSHSVLGAAPGTIAPRFYQVGVTGGNVSATTSQAFTHAPDTAVNRWMPSLAVDGLGDMAIGYSAASPTLYPAIRYAGRLSTDPVNTLPQTETSLVEGNATSFLTTRWGDYSSMSLDPDRCTFWVSSEYYLDLLNWVTRIGSFRLSNAACDPVTTTLSGKVTDTVSVKPIAGATVSLGSRTSTTSALGIYAFNGIAWGTYPSMTVTAPGYNTATATSIAVSDNLPTTKNFSLSAVPASACSTDTTQADFQFGVPSDVDLTTNPGDAVLGQAISIDQQNTVPNTPGPFEPILAQTFTPAVTDRIRQVDLAIFCANNCSTVPDVTVSIRATSGSPAVPTGPDLATATVLKKDIPIGGYVSAVFASPPILTAGTRYAIVMAVPSPPDAATLHTTNSNTDAYPNDGLVYSNDGGSTWVSAPANLDILFRTYVPSLTGDLISRVKDANPASGFTPTWSTLSWTAATPANTTLRFQAAGSNSQYGPFIFVGPDGSAATYYTTTGGSLAQFNGKRYLRYRAYLATSVRPASATPTLSDATVCFTNLPPPDLSISNSDGAAYAVAGATVVYTITATNPDPIVGANSVTVADDFLSGLTCNWTCTGSGGGSCLASGSGNINDTSVNLPASSSVTYSATCSIAGFATGTITSLAQVTFAGDPNVDNNRVTDIDTLRTSARCYVRADATGTNTGASWPNAYADLQSALHDSSCNEIWVARGVYMPTSYVDASSRSASFLMPRGVGVYGGFAGGETLLAQRDVAANLTVLSGDIDDNDTGHGGVDANTGQIVGNNSFHIVVFDGTTPAGPVSTSTVLDGFTITGGKADDVLSAGGGAYCNGSGGACSPLLNDLTFSGNLAVYGGGALYNGGLAGISSPLITNSTFSGNAAANGGAIYDDGSSGGTSNPSIANATFSNNSASSCGGAIYDDASDFGTSSPIIRSVTFSGNSADSANGDGSAICDFTATGINATALTNAVVWGNTSPEISTYSGGMTLDHVVLQENACPNGASCSTAPIGIDPNLGPLQNNGGFTRTMMPGVGSSAINAGLDSACVGAPVNALDQRGIARPLGAHCDVGAVEATQLSLSVDDGTLFGLYGKTLQYVVTLHNQSATDTVNGVHLSGETSAGLDAANTLWLCTGGTCTTTQTQGPFADDATVQPNGSVIWIVNVPIMQSTAPSATMTIHASAAGAASDTDTLVIFRGTFETP